MLYWGAVAWIPNPCFSWFRFTTKWQEFKTSLLSDMRLQVLCCMHLLALPVRDKGFYSFFSYSFAISYPFRIIFSLIGRLNLTYSWFPSHKKYISKISQKKEKIYTSTKDTNKPTNQPFSNLHSLKITTVKQNKNCRPQITTAHIGLQDWNGNGQSIDGARDCHLTLVIQILDAWCLKHSHLSSLILPYQAFLNYPSLWIIMKTASNESPQHWPKQHTDWHFSWLNYTDHRNHPDKLSCCSHFSQSPQTSMSSAKQNRAQK